MAWSWSFYVVSILFGMNDDDREKPGSSPFDEPESAAKFRPTCDLPFNRGSFLRLALKKRFPTD
jgi:hypothetical protein